MSYELQRLFFIYGVKFVRFVNLTIIIYFFAVNGLYLLMLFLSRAGLFRHMGRLFFSDYPSISKSSFTPPISVIVPAFNEAENILDSTESLRKLDYPEAEIIIVNDGSTDATMKLLKQAYELQPVDRVIRKIKEDGEVKITTEPIVSVYIVEREIGLQRLVVVDKMRGGKADSLNAGILVSRYPYVCSVDADSMLESDALVKVVKPIVEDPKNVVATGGVIRVANGCTVSHGRVQEMKLPRKILPKFQIVEYLRAFLGSRFAQGQLNALLIMSGVFTLLRKNVVVAVGGFHTDSIVEDMDLIVRMQRYLKEEDIPYRIEFVPDPIAWTEVPSTLRCLARQRIRWHSGLMDVLIHNRRLLFRPKYGALGLIGMPYYFFFEMLGPVFELVGYIAIPLAYLFGLLAWPEFLLFIIAAFLFGTFLSIFALLLEEQSRRQYPRWQDLLKLIFYGLADNIFYRPLISVLRFVAIIRFARGEREWGEIERRGFVEINRPDSVERAETA